MVRESLSDPFKNFNNKSGHTALLWRGGPSIAQVRILDGPANGLDPSRFPQCRCGYNYPHRRNYEGHYPFISTGDFLWYESMEELWCMVLLEHTEDIISIASQPFCLSFRDNTRHYPDLFALHRDGRRTVYDVRPLERVDDRSRGQFAKTAEECLMQGWQYIVLHGVAGWQRTNLEWLACFRTEDMHPGSGDEDELLEYLLTPRTVAQAATRLDAAYPAFRMPSIYHLMFRQGIAYDHSAPLRLDTTIWTGRSHATCHSAR
jgi:hypothetical protein